MNDNENYYRLLPKPFIDELEAKIRQIEANISEVNLNLAEPLLGCSEIIALQNQRLALCEICTKHYDAIDSINDEED